MRLLKPSLRALVMPVTAAAKDSLRIQLSLAIPRGQDLLIGDGQGVDFEIEPQRIIDKDGKQAWRLPGSTLRGLFKTWMTRLAAREGKLVADSARGQGTVASHLEYNRDNLGWCFLHPGDRQPGLAHTDCLIASLFGSLFQAGRIHIADAFAPCSPPVNDRHDEEQQRMHVAVDRITGGAAESMLFFNTVLTALPNGKSPTFDVTILIQHPNEVELRWLAKTLRALDVGVLRIGSSKSSGRLSLAQPPTADGTLATQFLATWNKRREAQS